MRTLPKFVAALAFLSSVAPAFAEAGAFAEWLSGDQPECIPLGEVNKAVMVGIIDRDWVCARFTAPDSLVNLIIEVGKGGSSEQDSPREDRGSSQ